MTPSSALSLPSDLSILAVGELLPHWLSWLDTLSAQQGGASLVATIDASGVTEVDSAGLQLLVALGNALEARGWTLQLHGVNEPLGQSCAQLGLGSWLRSRQHPVALAGAVS